MFLILSWEKILNKLKFISGERERKKRERKEEREREKDWMMMRSDLKILAWMDNGMDSGMDRQQRLSMYFEIQTQKRLSKSKIV